MKAPRSSIPGRLPALAGAAGLLLASLHVLLPGVGPSTGVSRLLVAGIVLLALAGLAGRRRLLAGTIALLVLVSAVPLWAPPPTLEGFEESWRNREMQRLRDLYGEVGTFLERMDAWGTERVEGLASEIAALPAPQEPGYRSDLFRLLSGSERSLETGLPARAAGLAAEEVQPGIQVITASGLPVAWMGRPQRYSDEEWKEAATAGPGVSRRLRRSSFYTVLTHGTWVRDAEGENLFVALDQPLAINYKVNNQFLRSWSLAAAFVQGQPGTMELDYETAPGPGQTRTGREGDRLRLSPPLTTGTPASGLHLTAFVENPAGGFLFQIRLSGRPARLSWESEVHGREDPAHVALLVLYVLLGSLLFRALPAGPRWRIPALAALVFGLRYGLVRLDLPGRWIDGPLYDPSVFAALQGLGFFRSAGDFLLTAVLLIATLYGCRKIVLAWGRTAPGREAARRDRTGPSRPRPGMLLLKSGAGVLLLGIGFWLSGETVSRVVANANPRLLGAQASLFSLPVATLHFALLLVLSSLFLLVLFGLRRLLDGGSFRENLGAVLLAVAVVAVPSLLGGHPHYVLSAVVLGFLAFSYRRMVRRDDLISVVFASFLVVVLASSFVYFSGQSEYDRLRRNLVLERAAEFLSPEESWRYFVLEDVMETLSREMAVPAADYPGGLENAAFDLWANGTLSYLGYPCAYTLLDAEGGILSQFAIELPYQEGRYRFPEPVRVHPGEGWEIREVRRPRKGGTVYSYLGVYPAESDTARVVVELPYFDENLEVAALTGPQTPELLRNVQPGAVAPRIEEEGGLLLARLSGDRVVASSTPYLPPGSEVESASPVPIDSGEIAWREIELENGKFQYVVLSVEEGASLLAGFQSVRWFDILLEWSRVLSLDLLLTLFVLGITLGLRLVPPLRPFLPRVAVPRTLGYQQKLMGSFLIVALLPTLVLGLFSRHLVERRFERESQAEALEKVRSAEGLLRHLVEADADRRLRRVDAGDAGDPGEGTAPVPIPERGSRSDREGLVLADERGDPVWGAPPPFPERLPGLARRRGTVFFQGGDALWGARVTSWDGAREGTRAVYYRRIDDEDLVELAGVLGSDLNVYHRGLLQVSSRRALYAGRFLSPFLPVEALRRLALSRNLSTVAQERTGTYDYHVGYLALDSVEEAAANVLSVPMLLRTESLQREIDRTRAVIVGLVTLLVAATLGLGLFLASRIFDPIQNLVAGTRRVAEGDLAFQIPGAKEDEIGLLIRSFNRMTGSLRDARAELEERRRYLETVMRGIATGVIATSSGGRIAAVNPAVERLLGVRADDLVDRTPGELATAGTASAVFSLLEKREGDGKPFSEEVSLFRDGSLTTIKVAGTPLQAGRAREGSVIVLEDLTELIASKKLSAWAEMARQIAHEIKNPLTPMKLSAQFMTQAHRDRAEDFGEIFEEGIGTIMRQVEILRRIAGEFSTFGRVPRLVSRPVPLRAVLEDSLRDYGEKADGVRILFDPEPVPPGLRVRGDAEALRKVFVNLVENALDAMEGEGELRVRVEAPPAGEGASRVDGPVRVVFRDTGPGLSQEVQKRLFEPYFSTKTTGTGLGLAICRALVEQMEGRLTLENAPDGPGAVASVALRLEAAARNDHVEGEL
jgi:PAS domain S-box-containing protein